MTFIKEETVVHSLFWGFVIMLFDINISLGQGTIGLLPDFVGYLFLINGFNLMAQEGQRFIKTKPYAVFMAAYSLILYVLNIFGLTAALGGMGLLIEITALAVSWGVEYEIIKGIQDMEDRYDEYLNGDMLMVTWIVQVVATLATLIFMFFETISFISSVASLVAAVVFVIQFYRAKQYYYAGDNS